MLLVYILSFFHGWHTRFNFSIPVHLKACLSLRVVLEPVRAASEEAFFGYKEHAGVGYWWMMMMEDEYPDEYLNCGRLALWGLCPWSSCWILFWGSILFTFISKRPWAPKTRLESMIQFTEEGSWKIRGKQKKRNIFLLCFPSAQLIDPFCCMKVFRVLYRLCPIWLWPRCASFNVLRRPAAGSMWREWSLMNRRMFSQTDRLWGRTPLKCLFISLSHLLISLRRRWKETLAPAVNLLFTWYFVGVGLYWFLHILPK